MTYSIGIASDVAVEGRFAGTPPFASVSHAAAARVRCGLLAVAGPCFENTPVGAK